MSDTKYQVLCPDGKHRQFHQGHLVSGSWQGFVYADNRRVYGAVPVQTSCFIPNANAKYAHLVEGEIALAEAVDHAIEEIEHEATATAAEVLATLDSTDSEQVEEFALARSVN